MKKGLFISLILIASLCAPSYAHGAHHSIKINCPDIELCLADLDLDIDVDVDDTLLQIRINDSLLQISIDSLKLKIKEAVEEVKKSIEAIDKEALEKALEQTERSLRELERGALWSSSYREEAERTVDKKIKIKKGITVSIKNQFGDIEVIPTNTDEVKIHAEIQVGADSKREAREYAEKVEIKTELTRSELKIETIYPEKKESERGRRQRLQHQVALEISVPLFAPVRIENSYGGIEARDLEAALYVGGKFGGVEVLDCSNIEINNSHGGVYVENAKEALIIENHFGGVEVEHVDGPVTVDNSHGGIEVREVKQNAKVYNKYGSIELSDIRGDCEVRNMHGPVELSDVATVDVINQHGPVTIENATGKVGVENAHGSVTVEIYESPIPEISVVTSFQPIELILPDDAACKISAETSFGSIDSDFTLNVEKSRHTTTASGVINRGKTKVDLETQHSSIYIRKR
jgi:hypothetical protein